MGVVRRNDRHRVDAVVQPTLPPGHLGEVRVSPVGPQQQILAGKSRPLGIRRERAGNELPAVVEPRRYPMYRADERAAPAADHAETEPAVEPLVL